MSRIFTGKTIPLICVPITAKTTEQFKEQLKTIIEVQPHMIEWRADFFSNLSDTSEIIELIDYVKSKTSIPLMFTIRSEREGGEKTSLTETDKLNLLQEICEKTSVDLIDFEVMNDREKINFVRQLTARRKIELVLSYHHFSHTPSNAELIKIATMMEFYGGDVAKLAVMPNSMNDVHRLLTLTRELDILLNVPIVTMSMGELGVLSRIIGWAYGSQLTFAVGVESSAPGQVSIEKLKQAINAVQTIMPAQK